MGLSVIAFVLVVAGAVAQAQQPSKVPRIGFLSGGSPNTNTARDEAFRHGLQALGYIEGKNIVIESRFAENNPDRYRGLAAELVRLNVEVIVTAGSALTSAAKAATTAGAVDANQFIDEMKKSGFFQQAIERGNLKGAVVPK